MFTVTTLPVGRDDATRPDDRFAAKFAVEVDGELLAGGELCKGSPYGDESGQLINVRWSRGGVAAARAIAEAAIDAAPPGAELQITTNTEVHDWLDERLALATSLGFVLWQEKEGFWFTDRGQPLPAPEGVAVRTLADVGRDAYASVVTACTAGTLDRVDADAVASMGARGWADALIGDCYDDADAASWFVISHPAGGEHLGFVAVGAFDEEATGTVLHIGVVPGHRGHGYVDQLLRLANLACRARGWKGMLSDVDVTNAPMMAAMERAGHHAADRPWHKWVHRMRTSG